MPLPTKAQFEQYGMDLIDGIPASAWAELSGPITIHLYSDETKTNPRVDIIKENFSFVLKQTNDNVIDGDIQKLEVALVGPCRVLLSFDQGLTYETYGTAWESVDLSDLSAVKTKAMTSTKLASIPKSAYEGKRNFRIAFLIELMDKADEVVVSSLKTTVIPDPTSTPAVGSIGVEVKELSIEGRLKELERMNAMQLAKLNFKAGAILGADQLMLHDMKVDVLVQDTAEIIELVSGQIGQVDLIDGEADILEDGFLYSVSIDSGGKTIKMIEVV